jgi:hypothetical protein
MAAVRRAHTLGDAAAAPPMAAHRSTSRRPQHRAAAPAQTRACGHGSPDDRFHPLGARRLAIGLPRFRSRGRSRRDGRIHVSRPHSRRGLGNIAAVPRATRVCPDGRADREAMRLARREPGCGWWSARQRKREVQLQGRWNPVSGVRLEARGDLKADLTARPLARTSQPAGPQDVLRTTAPENPTLRTPPLAALPGGDGSGTTDALRAARHIRCCRAAGLVRPVALCLPELSVGQLRDLTVRSPRDRNRAGHGV